MKLPVLIPYISFDKGRELKYSLRSLKNVINWNREVFIVGDKETWFNELNHIPMKRIHGKPYFDQVKKMKEACEFLPEKFIVSMDDIFITEPVMIKVYYKGLLKEEENNTYQRTKGYTLQFLRDRGIEHPLDFECHAPMLVDRQKFIETLELIISSPNPDKLQWRSIYGNLNKIKALLFEDKKTKTDKLLKGPIISTSIYTKELDLLFPDKSSYEI